jgi:hypothetical protein
MPVPAMNTSPFTKRVKLTFYIEVIYVHPHVHSANIPDGFRLLFVLDVYSTICRANSILRLQFLAAADYSSP